MGKINEKTRQKYLELVHEEMLRRGYKTEKKRGARKSGGSRTFDDYSEDNLFSLDGPLGKFMLLAAEQ